MTKVRERASVLGQRALCPGVYDLRLLAPQIAAAARPGQFVNVFLNNGAHILPRPISLCGIDSENGILRLVYRVTREGSGTEELSRYTAGTELLLLGPLGNGFPTELDNAAVVGGGIGIPPLLELLWALPGKKTALLGYRSKSQLFLLEDFAVAADEVKIATEDGSLGIRGNVVDLLRALPEKPKAILSCGPLPMLRALKAYAAEEDIPLWVSMEERMACGIGACLGCITESAEVDAHSNVKNKRVCADGPVFRAEEVVL